MAFPFFIIYSLCTHYSRYSHYSCYSEPPPLIILLADLRRRGDCARTPRAPARDSVPCTPVYEWISVWQLPIGFSVLYTVINDLAEFLHSGNARNERQ